MAAVLKNAAVANANKGQPSSFYNKDKPNPVYQALEQEFKKFAGYMKKRSTQGYRKPDDESYSRPADTLFELWNKYEHRLPKVTYQQKLLEMGDFLMTIKEYKLALWQCYERYLQDFGDVNVEEITDVDSFRQTFFASGFDGENAGLTFRALMGKSISMYQVVRLSDPKLQNKQSVDRCVQILVFLRLVMQVVLPKESLCWLVYNGTVHIYSISRHLMTLGHSSSVLEFLLWASMCMETCIPLIAVKYLSWRCTLYTAVCQCYYDCKAGQHAEGFARRGLSKINELNKLENVSSAQDSPEIEYTFREATVKMAVMVYKRSVMETRRKPKGILRPKTRANLKDAINLPWPRTPSEKLLADMFEGSSSQFLAILESLQDTNRRTLLTSPPAPDNEPEILDVFCELFMAAIEVLAGGGGSSKVTGPKPMSSLGGYPLAAVVLDRELMEMSTNGEDGVPITAVIKLVKLAYNYEHWDTFDLLVDPLVSQLKMVNDERFLWHEKSLELLQAMEKLNSSNRRHRRMINISEEEKEEDPLAAPPASGQPPPPLPVPTTTPGTSQKSTAQDDLITLAEVLLSIVNGSYQQEKIEIDMVVDAGLFLWNKCKSVFQKFQTGSVDNPRYLQKMDNPSKWMFLLDAVHQVLCWCGISSVDPALTAEVVLRLALVYESSAHLDTLDGDQRSLLKDSKTTLTDFNTATQDTNQQYLSRASMFSSSGNITARGQLLQAREILELGLQNVSFARQAVALNDGKNIADVSFVKELNPDVFSLNLDKSKADSTDKGAAGVEKIIPPSHRGSATAVWNTVKDLHMELILMYHRVCLKLANLREDTGNKDDKRKRKTTSKTELGSGGSEIDMYVESFEELSSRCNKNNLSKALLYMQRAYMTCHEGKTSQQVKKLFEESAFLIQKAQSEEKRLYLENKALSEMSLKKSKIPPPPILLCRTDSTMVFKPAPFEPESGEKVAWYRLFGRSASGANVKVRINDYYLPGTGEEVPSFHCELKATDLSPNDRYVFAVGAYTFDGKLIGSSVGETSKPILASHPLPVLMTWAFLSQIAYQVGSYVISRQACDILWDHFLAEKPPSESPTFVTSVNRDFRLTLLRLNQKAVCISSPVLLRQFLTAIFISVDISVRDGQLFCDVLCDKGPLYTGQISRLRQCEKLLVGIELAGWLNEANLALQAVVQCYGLLCPLLFYKIPSPAIIQVLQRCHAVLQEIPAGLIQKRQGNIADSLHHMTACVTFHMTKVLRTWGQRTLASQINECGRQLLAIEVPEEKGGKSETNGEAAEKAEKQETTTLVTENTDVGSMTLKAMKRQTKKRIGPNIQNREEQEGPVNEELKALTAHILSQAQAAQHDHELSGNEDPSILHAYIAYLPSRMAYREVSKFKRRARYLEFFVYVAQKALTEGMAELVIDWSDDAVHWLSRRNEQVIGQRAYMSKQPGVITIGGDDPKKFAAAMVEYSKEKDATSRASARHQMAPSKTGIRVKKKAKYRPIGVTPHMTDTARHAQEERELKALDKLGLYLPDAYRQASRRKRLRKICVDELPWRTQLNIIQGLSHFGAFLHKLEKREKVLGSAGTSIYRTSFLDQEWFTLETSGTLVVGWEGGPPRQVSRVGQFGSLNRTDEQNAAFNALDLASEHDKTRTTGIEVAAAAATGLAPPPLYIIPKEVEDTPRTYRSDQPSSRVGGKHPETETALLSTKVTVEALTKTFTYFRHAVVLAHRGQHWTLLQNASRALWNCAHTALIRAYTSNQVGGDSGLVTSEVLRSLVWLPLFTAADCLLDMLGHLQVDLEQHATKAKNKGRKIGNYFESWFGDIKNEKGGASLKFETPLDDLSIVDVRFIRRLVLRVLEMLYYEKKWEKLTDIALRFSALSNDRYAEQVVPLLVQAQRKLDQRVRKHQGTSGQASHIKSLMIQLRGITTAKDYLKSQLKISLDKSRLQDFEPGSQLDPTGHNVHAVEDSLKLPSVPLQYENSLEVLREAVNSSHYTSRALQHSRKLLVLYLGGQMNTNDSSCFRSPSKVDFLPNTAGPQPTVPPDLSEELFLSVDDVQTSPVPKSQLGTVVSSYEKTIEMLLAKNQKGVGAQAMKELGYLMHHMGNIRGAYRYWSDALDIILSNTDAIHTWRELLEGAEDASQELLKRCGVWGCLVGGILASNIAQYVLTSDLGLRMECCFLSGFLFKGLFRASLPHPTADRDYAMYEVGEGCEVTNLVPGIDFTSDRFRCDGRQLVSALRWVTEELSRGKHNLFVLPLLTLYQYFTTFVCRDLQRVVDGRILKVRILTDLNLFTEAMKTLQRLLHGERLPHTGDSSFRQVESHMNLLQFNTSKPVTDPNNQKVLDSVIDKRLSSRLGTLYGPHMTCHLSIVQAHLFIALAECIPVLGATSDDMMIPEGQVVRNPRTISTISRSGMGSRGLRMSSGPLYSVRSLATDHSKDDEESEETTHAITNRFTNSKKAVTGNVMKGTLLSVADKMVTTISEVILENAEHDKAGEPLLSAAELELVVLAKLEHAVISRQKHHAPLAARIVLSALKMLQNSDIFKPKKETPPPPRPSSMKGRHSGSRRPAPSDNVKLTNTDNTRFQYQNFQSRSRLDARLWLHCRLALVSSLLLEIKGMGDIKGSDARVLTNVAECRQYCAEGLSEAEACGDVEMQAEFMLQGAQLNIIEGKSLEHTSQLLLDAAKLLQGTQRLSNQGERLLVTCMVMKTDLDAVCRKEADAETITQTTLQTYLRAQTLILSQMEQLGEKIEHHHPGGEKKHLSTPVSPLVNIYLPQCVRLTQVKLRIGHAMSRNVAKQIRRGTADVEHHLLWADALGVLSTALELSHASVTREANLEAEILYNMGKVQKMLCLLGHFHPRAAVNTLAEAIRTSYCTDHDLGLIRQCYLEIAMIYLHSSSSRTYLDSLGESGDESSQRLSLSPTSAPKKKTKSEKEKSRKRSTPDEFAVQDREREKRAAGIAIRCAGATAAAQRARTFLLGDISIIREKLLDNNIKDVPEFAVLDLISGYVLGEKKVVYKSEIEEELSTLANEQEVKHTETYEEQVNKAKTGALDISWIHFLGYQTILRRLCSTATICATSSETTSVEVDGGDLGPDFDLGFISHAQFDRSMNYDVVRSMLFSGTWAIRLRYLHNYLAENLPVYAKNCCAVYPPTQLILPMRSKSTDLTINMKSYMSNLSLFSNIEMEAIYNSCLDLDPRPLPPGTIMSPVRQSDEPITSPGDNDAALQWYQPTLGETDPAQGIGSVDQRILLLQAITKKGILGINPAFQWVSHSQLIDLHDRLAVLTQRGDISLNNKYTSKKDAAATPAPAKPKKAQRIKALSPKPQKDEQLESLLRQCLDDCVLLVGSQTDQEPVTEIPFEVNQANIKHLERMFDLSFGLMLHGTDIATWIIKLIG